MRRSGAPWRRGSGWARGRTGAPCRRGPWGRYHRMALPDEIRAACARVAATARHVSIADEAVAPYAATLAPEPVAGAELALRGARARRGATCSSSTRSTSARAGSRRCASRPGSPASAPSSGAARPRPLERGGAAARRRRGVRGGVRPGPRAPLMGLFATRAARARPPSREHGGAFLRSPAAGDGSAVALAEHLAALPPWRTSRPRRRARAVLQARPARGGRPAPHGLAPAGDVAALTLLADNLVPHVLRSTACSNSTGAGRPDRPGGAARARLARGGGDPRVRRPRRGAARGRPRRDHGGGDRRRPVAPRCGAALQGASAPPRADDGLLSDGTGARGRPARAARRRPSRPGTRRGGPAKRLAIAYVRSASRNAGRPIRRSIRSSRQAPSK